MIFFLIIRVLDYISTYLNMNLTKTWADIEANPLPKLMIEKMGYFNFVVVNLLISFFLYMFFKKIKKLYIIDIFTVINLIVVLINFFTYYKTLQILGGE